MSVFRKLAFFLEDQVAKHSELLHRGRFWHPRSTAWYQGKREYIEDLFNPVTCCRVCNEFLNQYTRDVHMIDRDVQPSLIAFEEIPPVVYTAASALFDQTPRGTLLP